MIAEAIAIARDGQPGPVHVDVPIGVAEAQTDEPPPALLPPQSEALPAEAALAAAAAALATAARPLAIAGVDAVNESAGAAVAGFCRARGIPLVTTYKAKGLLPETDPLALGAAGLLPKADAILMPLVAAADCLLLLGYDPIEMRQGWRHPFAPEATVIEIAAVARRHGMHRVDLTLGGAIAPTLAAIDRRAGAAAPVWSDGAPSRARAALTAAFAAEGFGPAAVFHVLRAMLPPATVATADSGAHRILSARFRRCDRPRGLLQSSGLCTMACALLLAAGHALGQPRTPVLAVVGDAGLEMGMGEIATLRDLNLAVLVVVLVDGSLSLIEMKQRAAGYPPRGVGIGVSDLPAVARAMSGHGAWIEDFATLRTEAAAALGRDRFTLLAVRVGPRAYDGTF